MRDLFLLMFILILFSIIIDSVNAYDSECIADNDGTDPCSGTRGGLWFNNEDSAVCDVGDSSYLQMWDRDGDCVGERWNIKHHCHDQACYDTVDQEKIPVCFLHKQYDAGLTEGEKTVSPFGVFWDVTSDQCIQCGMYKPSEDGSGDAMIEIDRVNVYSNLLVEQYSFNDVSDDQYSGSETYFDNTAMSALANEIALALRTTNPQWVFSIPTVTVDTYVFPLWSVNEDDLPENEEDNLIEKVPKYKITFEITSPNQLKIREVGTFANNLAQAVPSPIRVGFEFADSASESPSILESNICGNNAGTYISNTGKCEEAGSGLCDYACNRGSGEEEDNWFISEYCDEHSPNEVLCVEDNPKVEFGKCTDICGLDDSKQNLCSSDCGADDRCDGVVPRSCSNEVNYICTDSCNPESVEDLEDFTKEVCWGSASDGTYWPECCYDQDDNDCDDSIDLASADCGKTDWSEFINGPDPLATELRTIYDYDASSWDYWQENQEQLLNRADINYRDPSGDYVAIENFGPGKDDNTTMYVIIAAVVIVGGIGAWYFLKSR